MPFHPIALHFHVAIFIVNLVALIALVFMRPFTMPNLDESKKPTRGQSLFQALDWVVLITLIAGVIATAAGIATGYVELLHPPEIGSLFVYDMFMQLKVYTSFLLLALYALPLLYRMMYGKTMWKSRGMAITFILLIVAGFFFLVVSTCLGSYYTTYLTAPYGAGESVELLEPFLNSIWWLFIPFGAAVGSNIHTYQPGYEIAVTIGPLLTTVFIIVDLCLISFVIFYGLRSRQIKRYNERYIKFKSYLRTGAIAQSNAGFQKLMREMMALKIKRID